MTTDAELKTGPIDVVKHRWWYIGVSLAFLLPGLYFIVISMMTNPNHAPLKLGIDFTGGTLLEYGFRKPLTQGDVGAIQDAFEQKGYTGTVVQLQEGPGRLSAPPVEKTSAAEAKTASPAAEAPVASIVSIRSKQLQGEDATALEQTLEKRFGSLVRLQKNSIGPTLASELLRNSLLALLGAYTLIVLYLSFRFQFDFAVCAIVALVHDTLFVIGMFSLFGVLFHTEVDSLFITALLTVVGFSVHDTIVVFDRLRENSRRYFTKKLPFGVIANISVNQTLARSINTSLTALLTLLALYFFGGSTTQDFVLAMILGIVVGTYSSIFVASATLTWWRERSTRRAATA